MIPANHVMIKFLFGKSSRKTYHFFLWFAIIGITLSYIVSFLLYDGTYSILTHSVSSLGNQIKNPEGSWVWRSGMIIGGISIFPIINYIYHSLNVTANITSKMYWVSAQLSCLGVIGVGIFPENKTIIHHSIAAVTFFGFMFAFCCNIYTFSKLWKSELNIYRKIGMVLIYLTLIFTMIGFLLAFLQFGLYFYWDQFWPPFNLHLPLFEWLIFGSDLLYIAGIFFLIPPQKNMEKNIDKMVDQNAILN
jgi:hypothetical membrane protein